MRLKTLKISMFTFALGMLFWPGCSSNSSTSTTTTPPDPAASSAPAATAPTEGGLVAGAYCYSFKNVTLTMTAEMDYDGSSKVEGTIWGEIQDQENSYFSSYVTDFEGVRNGANLDVNTKTEIEGDVQEEKASWPWDGKTLTEGQHNMTQVDCEPHD